MANVFPGGLNTYIPQAQAQLQTDFSQNPSLFAINRYVTVAPVQQPSGYYIYHDPNEETRIDFTNLADMVWADGAQPQVNFGKATGFVPFTCVRYHQMFTIGDVAAENAQGWNVITDHSNSAMMRLMTVRTFNVINKLITSGNWGSNTDTATNLGGGQWDAATSTNNYIKKTINACIQAIQKATNGVVGPEQLTLIVAPNVAYAMAQSQEIIDYFKQSFVAKEYVNQAPGSGFFYGIPDPLYGVRVIVEDRVRNTGAHGGTLTNNYMVGKNAILVARPGSIMGGLNTMSTVTLAMYQDMNLMLEHRDLWKLTEGVLWDYYETILQNASGYLITAVIA